MSKRKCWPYALPQRRVFSPLHYAYAYVSLQHQLYVFVFDENYGNLSAVGSAVNLSTWYAQGLKLLCICFVCGSEEILLIDSDAQARIFSLITLQFRYNFLVPNLMAFRC